MSLKERILHDFITYVVLGGIIYKGISELLKRLVLKPLWAYLKRKLLRTEQQALLFAKSRHRASKKPGPPPDIDSVTI